MKTVHDFHPAHPLIAYCQRGDHLYRIPDAVCSRPDCGDVHNSPRSRWCLSVVCCPECRGALKERHA